MGRTFEEMKKEFGSVEMDGKEFVLIDHAHYEGCSDEDAHYEAYAVNPCDVQDSDDCYPCYAVHWSILPETWEYWKDGGEDEGDACDWDSPEYVEKVPDYDDMRYNVSNGHIV